MKSDCRVSATLFTGGLMTLLASLAAQADLSLQFDIATKSKSTAAESNASATSSSMRVLLGESYFLMTEDGNETYFDFDAKRIYSIDRDAGLYEELSLFAPVGFRSYEIRNRKYMSDILTGAGVTSEVLHLVQSEHELSIEADGPAVPIDMTETKESIVFSIEGTELLVLSRARHEIPAEYSGAFLRFIRHQFGGHPAIVGNLVSADGVPERIRFVYGAVGNRSVTLSLAAVELVPPPDNVLAGLRRQWSDDSPVGRLSALVGETPGDAVRKRLEAIRTSAQGLQEDGHLVEAMLRSLEYSLIVGDRQLPWSDAEREKLAAAADVQAALALTGNPTSEDEARELIAALGQLRAEFPDATVLMIFEANDRAYVKQYADAKELLIQALEANPYIAGAWKDLGGLYFAEYDVSSAWTCWDTGRLISPNHVLLQDITRFEQQLQKDYPDFF